jgi:sarcosine oxidase subunit delta
MTSLSCPFCGVRELAEFAFHKTLPNAGDDPLSAVYLRINQVDDSHEYWQHVRGCRAWLKVRRNPSTGEVLEMNLLGAVTS